MNVHLSTINKAIKSKARKEETRVVASNLRNALCCAVYFVNPKKPHKCSDVTCKNCGEFAHVAHRCYIQPIFEEQPQQQDDEDFEDSLPKKKKKGPPPPTLNFAPIECAFTKDQAFEPNLIY